MDYAETDLETSIISNIQKFLMEMGKGNRGDDEDKLLDELAAHGVHSNMSFFAFIVTPKEKTFNMFGWKDENGGYHQSGHAI